MDKDKCKKCFYETDNICYNGKICMNNSEFNPKEKPGRTYANMFVDDMREKKKDEEVTYFRCETCKYLTPTSECGYFETHEEPLMEDSEHCDGYHHRNIEVKDNIKPTHYNSGKYDIIWFCQYHNISFDIGNIMKYIFRAGKKDKAKELEDLRKAKEYLERRIEFVEAKEK